MQRPKLVKVEQERDPAKRLVEALEADDAPEKKQKKPRTDRTGFWITTSATILSLYWTGAVTAFLLGRYSIEELSVLPIDFWGIVSLVLFLPIVFIWMVAVIAKRAHSLKLEATNLAQIALRLTEPEEQASRGITRLGHAVRRQISGLESELEQALGRVEQLEASLKAQAQTMTQTATEAETKVATMRDALEKERKNLADLTENISEQSNSLSAVFHRQSAMLTKSSEEAALRMDKVQTDLESRIHQLEVGAASAYEKTTEAGNLLAAKTTELKETSESARLNAEQARETYEQQSKSLSETADTFAEEKERLASEFREQRLLLGELTTEVSNNTKNIENVITTTTAELEDAVAKVAEKTEDLSFRFVENAERVKTSGEEASDALNAANQAAQDATSQSKEALDATAAQLSQNVKTIGAEAEASLSKTAAALTENADQIKREFQSVSDKARATLNRDAESMKTVLISTAEETRDAISDSSTQLKQDIMAASTEALNAVGRNNEQIKQSILELSKETREAIAANSAAFKDQVLKTTTEARDAFKEHTKQLTEDIEKGALTLTSTMKKLSADNDELQSSFDAQAEILAQVPNLVASQSKKIEELVAVSASAIRSAVDDAANHASKIEDQIKTHTHALQLSGAEATSTLTKSLLEAQKVADQTRDTLTLRTNTIIHDIENAGTAAEKAIETAQQALEERSSTLKELISQSGDAAEEAAKNARGKLHNQLDEMRRQITQSADLADEAAGQLANALTKIETSTKNAGTAIDGSMVELENRIDQFPDQAKESAERLRDIVATQLNALTEVAETSANKVMNLDQAFQARMKGIYDTLGQMLPMAGEQPQVPQQNLPKDTWKSRPDLLAEPETEEEPEALDEQEPTKEVIEEAAPDAPVEEAQTETEQAATPNAPDPAAERLAQRLRKNKIESSLSIQADQEDEQPSPLVPEGGSIPRAKARLMKWRDILSAADAQDGPDDEPIKLSSETSVPDVSRTSVHRVETLQAMSVDLCRALEKDVPVELVKQYMDGERNLFARRLAKLNDKDTASSIKQVYHSDPDFKDNVDRYLSEFEALLELAWKEDEEGALAETYRSADTGKVYALLSKAID